MSKNHLSEKPQIIKKTHLNNKLIKFDYICAINNFKYIKIMKRGTVKFFNESKGFGFIKSDESGEEIFVHVTGLNDQIQENDKVTFDVAEGKKGLNAVNVKRA